MTSHQVNSSTIIPKLRTICRHCHVMTHHILQAEYTHVFDLDDYPDLVEAYAKGAWKIWQCQGCDTVQFEEAWEVQGHDDRWQSSFHFYPEISRDGTISKKHYMNLPKELVTLYEEIVTAFNTKSLLLCTAGLRMLIEGVCANKNILDGPNDAGATVKTLDGKINAMSLLVSEGIVKNLHSFRFLGNDALHKLIKPDEAELTLAIKIIEDVLNVIYELDYKSERLYQQVINRKSTPPIPTYKDEDLPF